jgi:hypothetical protein
MAAGFLSIAPLARADPAADNADLIGILRTIHADRCGFDNWRGPGNPVVISDRPWPTDINEITRRPFEQFGIAMMPRAPAGTLWPRVTLCAGVGVVDHVRLELVVKDEAAVNPGHALNLGFGARSFEMISLPAFSADGKRAVVFRAHVCPLCGNGSYLEVIRTPYGWRVGRRLRIWAS